MLSDKRKLNWKAWDANMLSYNKDTMGIVVQFICFLNRKEMLSYGIPLYRNKRLTMSNNISPFRIKQTQNGFLILFNESCGQLADIDINF